MSDLDDEELEATRRLNGVAKESEIEDDIKILEDWLKELDDFFEKTRINNTKERNALRNVLAERKQDKARIKELENRLRDINTYILINGIDEPLKTATQIKLENQQQYIIQEKINLLKKKLENSIPKQKVKDLIKDEIINISGFECIPVEDIQELLEEK